MGYTEKTVLYRGLDFDSGRTSNHSAGGVAGTGSITPTNSEPNTQNSSVTKVFKESFIEGYKKGVKDEIECVETSGEHLSLQKRLARKKHEN